MKEKRTGNGAYNKYHFRQHAETIRGLYKHQGDSRKVLQAIGLEVTKKTVAALRIWMRTHGILKVSKFYWGEHPKEAIALYESGKSLKQCVVLFGQEEKTDEFFRRWLHSKGIALRGLGRRGELHGSWRGGVKMSKGYRMVQHPNGSVDKNNRRVYVFEHRLVMEQFLNRPLLSREVVHHKNGDVLDNRIENLEVFVDNADHLRHTLKGHIPNWTEEGKKNILASVRKPRKWLLKQDLLF